MINVIKGLLIGLANIIPGVSGGTFALVLGIYTRLIDAVNKLSFNIFNPSKFKSEFKKADGAFLLQLFGGALMAIAGLAWIMDYLLKFHPGPTLAFFAGLIIASVVIPYRMIEKKNFKNIIYIIPGILLVYFIYWFRFAAPGADLSLFTLFISAAVAISAMILPGISGSFILLILGVYQPIITNIKSFLFHPTLDSFRVLTIFGLGCLAGLVFFVRVMQYLLHKQRDKTLSFLVGLVAGSLIVLWPFKAYPNTVLAEKVDIAIITARNIMPTSAGELFYYLIFFTAGIVGARGLKLLEKNKDN